MLARSANALFAGLIDYAGLFPPAALPMTEAVANYIRYRRGDYDWMLGKFVVPAGQVSEVPSDLPLSIIGVDEIKAATAEDVERIAERAKGRAVYVEVTDLSLIEAIARSGLRAKIRTGGLTADVFPDAAFVADFMRTCASHGVAFKATAGLHHPIRCVHALTYEPDAPRGTMHGFVNLFLAAALLDRAEEILRDDDPRSFVFEDDAASWRGHAVATGDLERIRKEFAISFGSCSFEEPVADLQRLGWL